MARWPGSTHDSFILRNSGVGRRLEAGAVQDGWLLGKDYSFLKMLNIIAQTTVPYLFSTCRGQWIPTETVAPHPISSPPERTGTDVQCASQPSSRCCGAGHRTAEGEVEVPGCYRRETMLHTCKGV